MLEIENKLVIDCFGDLLPCTNSKIKEQLKSMKVGDSFVLVSDHSCVVTNAQSTFPANQVRIEFIEPINGVWELTITKLRET